MQCYFVGYFLNQVIVRSYFFILSFTVIFSFHSSPAFAWERHQSLLPWILKSFSKNHPNDLQRTLRRKHHPLCYKKDVQFFTKLAKESQIRISAFPQTLKRWECSQRPKTTIENTLSGIAVDEPDLGMDSHHPERHFFFPGWSALRPISTLQIPLSSSGTAVQTMIQYAQLAKALVKKGELAYGARILAWALHYLQDLSEPFRVVQIPSSDLIEWQSFFSWQPGPTFFKTLKNAAAESGKLRTHYEQHVLSELQKGVNSQFVDCLIQKDLKLNHSSSEQVPRILADMVIKHSLKIAPSLATAVLDQSLNQTFDLTCKVLQKTSIASQELIRWVFQE